MKRPKTSVLFIIVLLSACASRVYTTRTAHEAFAIYLLGENVSMEQVFRNPLEKLPLQETPILSEPDILGYDPQTYTMQLRPEAAQRLRSLRVPVSGIPFVVKVGDEPIYAGAFWTSLSSLSFDEGVVIDVLRMGQGDTLYLQLGYPEAPGRFQGRDLRNDPRILQALQEAGII